MNGIIQIVSGFVIGGVGFHQIAEHPIQGICALFLAGFLVMIGFEKMLPDRSRDNQELKPACTKIVLKSKVL